LRHLVGILGNGHGGGPKLTLKDLGTL